MGKVDVSVIIPTYNRADYIVEAIQSVLDQDQGTHSVEIIVVDDGSTDDTEQQLKRFGSKITYRKIPNSGRPAVPRNIGIKMARGELIAFQDSDDRWPKDKLRMELPAFDDPEIALVYGNAEVMTADGKLTGKTVITSTQGKSGDIFADLAQDNFISTLTVIARKAVIEDVGYFNESYAVRGVEDYELWLRISQKYQVKYLDEILAHYRKHDNNISTSDTYESHILLSHVFEALLSTGRLTPQNKQVALRRLTGLYQQLANLSTSPDKKILMLTKFILSKVRGALA